MLLYTHTQESKETFDGDTYVYNLDCGNDNTSLYIHAHLSIYIVCGVLSTDYISIWKV
jgi:hypothetical protein